MNDLAFSFEQMLIATGYTKKDVKVNVTFPSLINDLINYVNSTEYQKLIIEETKKNA